MTQDPQSVETPDAMAERAERRDAALKAHHRSRRWRGRAFAAAAGVGAVALVAGVTTAGSLLPTTTPAVDGAAQPARLAALGTTSVCPPALRLPEGAASGTDAQFSPVSTSAQLSARVLLLSDLAGHFPGTVITPVGAAESAPGQELTPPQPPEVQQGAPATAGEDGVPVRAASVHTVTSGLSVAKDGTGAAGHTATVEPLGGEAPVSSTVFGYSASDGDLAGLAAADCLPPAHRHWLTGAATTLGTTSVLTLVNPSASPSTVDLDLYGTKGPVEAAGARGIVLAPGQSTSIILGGLAPDHEHLAVAVRAAGGAVSASIQQHRLDGVTPAGVDLLQSSAPPAPTAVIPGVRVPAAAVLEGLSNPVAGPSVLLAAPSTSGPLTATVTVLGAEGEVKLPQPAQVELVAGGTARVPLNGLPAGEYTVTVRADAPVLASARGLDTMAIELPEGGTGTPVDTAVSSAAAPLGLEQAVALPSHAGSHLVLAAPEGGSVEVTAVSSDGSLGAPLERKITAGRQVHLDVAKLKKAGSDVSGLILRTTSGQVYAGLTQRSELGVSAFAVQPQPEQAAGVPVRVRP